MGRRLLVLAAPGEGPGRRGLVEVVDGGGADVGDLGAGGVQPAVGRKRWMASFVVVEPSGVDGEVGVAGAGHAVHGQLVRVPAVSSCNSLKFGGWASCSDDLPTVCGSPGK